MRIGKPRQGRQNKNVFWRQNLQGVVIASFFFVVLYFFFALMEICLCLVDKICCF